MAEIAHSLADETATRRLAEDLAVGIRAGDVIRLEGDLGAGKTSFARAFLRAFADDAGLEVPSPTFTLVQTYDFQRLSIAHFDLYRLMDANDLDEIGFDDAIRAGAALIEWPERGGDTIPADALTIRLDPGPDAGARVARIDVPAAWADRISRTLTIRAFLAANGWGAATRRLVKADASARTIERIAGGDSTRILMNHPPETDDAAGRLRRAARSEARLAEDTRAFGAIARALHALGLSAPVVDAHDADVGLVLMEDFGGDFIAEAGRPVAVRYLAAVEVLAALHARDLPRAVADGSGGMHTLPEYDLADFLTQLTPFPDWAIPHLLGREATIADRETFSDVWRPALIEVLAGPKTWALRDYHSPNLMWLPERTGIQRVGLLDFQDAALIHPAYDLASVAQDARVTIPPDLEAGLVQHYIDIRRVGDAAFDEARFRRAYAILAAQRATRILGIFARLNVRDARPEYLAHYPRVAAYLARTLALPVLADIRTWMDRHAGVVFKPLT